MSTKGNTTFTCTCTYLGIRPPSPTCLVHGRDMTLHSRIAELERQLRWSQLACDEFKQRAETAERQLAEQRARTDAAVKELRAWLHVIIECKDSCGACRHNAKQAMTALLEAGPEEKGR